MPDVIVQLGQIRNAMKRALGPHPGAPLPGTFGSHPRITPEGAKNVASKLRPSLVRAVGADDFEDLYAETDPVQEQIDDLGFLGIYVGDKVAAASRIRSVAGLKRAELAAQAGIVGVIGATETLVDGTRILSGTFTSMFWGGLNDAALYGNSLSSQVTFGQLLEAAGQGAREGAEDVGKVAGAAVEKSAEVLGGAAKAIGGGFLQGLGPLGLIIGVGALIYVATELR